MDTSLLSKKCVCKNSVRPWDIILLPNDAIFCINTSQKLFHLKNVIATPMNRSKVLQEQPFHWESLTGID